MLDGMIHGCGCWNCPEGVAVVVIGVFLDRVEVGILGDTTGRFGGGFSISNEDIAFSEYFEFSVETSGSAAGTDIVSPVDSTAPVNAAVLVGVMPFADSAASIDSSIESSL